MAGGICLPKEAIEKVKAGIDTLELSKMTSAERREALSKIVGEHNAEWVNAQFESKLLLKSKQAALEKWVKGLDGVSHETKQDLISRIAKMDKILSPDEEKNFLSDLAAQKLGFSVNSKEAKQIMDLSQKVQQSAEASGRSTAEQSLQKGWKPTEADKAYGYAKYDFYEHMNDLKAGVNRVDWSQLRQPGGAAKVLPAAGHAFVNMTKTLGASMDDSFGLRQGIKVATSHNAVWRQEFKNSISNLLHAGFGDAKKVHRELMAEIMGDPMYDEATRNKLAISGNEDAMPSTFYDPKSKKTTLVANTVGRPFAASEVAFGGFASHLRFGVYKDLMRNVPKDAPTKYGENMANFVNSITGRGHFGKYDQAAKPANLVFYSARFIKAQFDTLALHPLGSGTGGTVDKFIFGKEGAQNFSPAQKEAIKHLAIFAGQSAAIMTAANQMWPGSVETDPRSSDFGKIKFGDTRFDVTGGAASYLVLAWQLKTNETKSGTSGVVKTFGKGYGSKNGMDDIYKFFENKTSPIASLARDEIKRQTYDGSKPTWGSRASTVGVPLILRGISQTKSDPQAASPVWSTLADFFGIASNTYGQTNRSTDTLSSTQQDFKTKIGDAKFNEANDKFNKRYNTWYNENKDQFDTLPNESKSTQLTTAKQRIQKQIYKEYGFTPSRKKTDKSQTQKNLDKSADLVR